MKNKNKSYNDAKKIVEDVIKDNKNIYSVQQCVLWTLTNYHDQRTNFTQNMNILYESLCAEAQNNRSYKENGGNNIPIIKTDKAVVNKNGVIGPFSIDRGPYTISAESKIGNSKVGNKLYKDKDCKNEISSSDNYNGNFYVKLNNTSFGSGNKYNVSINFKGKYLKTVDAKYWTTTNANINNTRYNPEGQGPQPLISFSKQTANYNASFSGSYSENKEGDYTIKLQKQSTTGKGSGKAKFNVQQYLSASTTATNTQTRELSMNSGVTTLYSVKIKDTKQDTYIIKETTPPSGYKLGDYKEVKIVVKKKLEDYKYKFDSYDIYLDGTAVGRNCTGEYKNKNVNIGISRANSSTSATITVTFKNEKITGSYQMSFVKKSTESTTNIDNTSDALGGATIWVTTKLNGDTMGSSQPIETKEKEERSINHTITNTEKEDIYEIKEIGAPQGYLISNLLKEDNWIRLKVSKGIENDKYVIKGVSAEIVAIDPMGDSELRLASGDLTKNAVFEFKDAYNNSIIEGVRLKFTSDKIVVELRNPQAQPFKFSLQKKSAESNQDFLKNTEMTVKRTVKKGDSIVGDAEKAIHTGPFEDEEAKFEYPENEVDSSYLYYYDIYEDTAQAPYKNILGPNMFLRVSVRMDDVGALSAEIKVKGVNGYSPTQTEIDEVMRYVDIPHVNPDTRQISIIVKNPKGSTSVNLQLFKHQLNDKNTPVKNAEYTIKEIDENGNELKALPGITTDAGNKQIAKIENGEFGKSYYYEIIENKVPENYVNVISGVRVKVEIDSEGKVNSSIIKIKQKDSNVWEDYNNTFEKHISISDPDKNNNIILYMANSVKFNFTLFKKNYATNTNLEDAEKFNGTANFKIEQIIGSQTVEKFNGPLEDAKAFFNEVEASANTTYKYRITETYVSDDFYDTLVNIPIILNIRTDADGKIMDESYMGSNWSFENPTGIPENQRKLMEHLVYLKIDANNQINLYIANMPKNYYSLQLVKVDKNGNTIKLRNATFEVGMETSNPDGQGIPTEEKTTQKGFLNITSESGTIIDPGYKHTYTIKETVAPAGYTKLEGTIKLEANFTDEGKLLQENIALKYINEAGVEETKEGLRFNYDDENNIPIIQVYIPNGSESFELELLKEDIKGNKIQANELQNGNIDGAHFRIDRLNVLAVPNTTTNATSNDFFEGSVINDILKDGTVNDIVPSFANLIYVYTINEISSKSDSINILEGYQMELLVTTDDNAKISDVTYQVINTNKGGRDETEAFKNLYGDLINIEINDTKDKVTIHIKNPYGYKVRLNKINTSGTPIEAKLVAYLDGNRKCALNGTYNKGDSNETYEVTGETTHLSEEYIVAGKKQIWTIKEIGVTAPYYNVFKNRDIEVEVEMNDQYELVVTGYTIKDSTTHEAVSPEELENLKQYIQSIEFVKEGSVNVLNITLKNPVKYRLKLTKYEPDGKTELHGAVLTVNGEEVISNGKSYYEVDNITDIGETIKFDIQEKSTAKNHINILKGEGTYLKIAAKLSEDGEVIFTNNSVMQYYGGNPKPIIAPSFAEVYDYINITSSTDTDGVPVINVGIINPLIYKFEVEKVDTSERKNPLSDARFEIYSPIMNEQSGKYRYSISREGVTLISNSGKIYGKTTEEGKISFEEKNMQVGKAYEYKITETGAPSNIYENIFKDYNIYVKVKIDESNLLILENYENGRNYEIRKDDGTKAPDSYYEYVTVNGDNTGDQSIIKVQVENPTKFKLKINKKIFGNDKINLANTKFELVSEISGTKELTTDSDGNIILDETPVKEGIYEYIIKEKDVPSKDIINILSDNYIKFRLYVAADGSIYTVNTEGQRADNTYYLYKADNSKLELDNTNIDDYVSIDTTGKIDNINTVEIKVLDPQKYNLTILKKDKDTNKPMNNIAFDITVFEDDETGAEKEVKLKDANTMQEKNLKGLKTSTVNGQEGAISINDILFEKSGTYKLKLHETSPEGYIEVGEVEIYITIEVIDGKYEVTNIYYETEFIDKENTKIIKEDGKDVITAQISLKNEKIKGSYNLNLNKTDLDGNSLDGAEVKITVLRNNTESELYEANDDVNSKNVVIPTQIKIEDGTLKIPNIRIEGPETYVIKIEEIKAPETYQKLEKPIQIQVTTKKEGEGLYARYVLENIKLVDENKLVQLENTEDELNVTIKNEQFDLALRKFITGIRTNIGTENENKQTVTTRIPVFKIDENGNYVYEHTKEPVLVANQNIVEYTIRVYNEGTINGYAKEIKDDIPEGLEFLPNDEINKEFRWVMLDQDGNITEDVNKAKYIISDYLSKEQEKIPGENLLKAFDKGSYELGNIKEPDYKEVKVAFKVTMPNTSDKIVVNQAQISDDSDEGGNDITDKDSTPNEWKGEDDEDIEKIKVLYFDLALRKWVTHVVVTENGNTQITETGHKAEDNPEEVVKVDLKKSKINNVLVKFRYSIRITNEGEIAGEAQEISDYIPKGLVFIPEDNPDWRQEGDKVVTEKLKGHTLQPGESAEVEITLTWVNSESNMGVMVNTAEISKDYNEFGTPDIDSTPNNKVPGEDDIDDAPVMLTVKTGSEIIMITTLGLGVVAVIGAGIIAIRKKILKRPF